MRLLLDTHTALWMFAGSTEISRDLEEVLTDPSNQVYFSDASAWEIVIKNTVGKLPLPSDPDAFISEMVDKHSLVPQTISLEAIFRWGKLPMIHRDPFDRLLVAQALQDDLTLVTFDTEIQKYSVPTFWI
jgi:PIN domain nuclease of toxin-antitoxin system